MLVELKQFWQNQELEYRRWIEQEERRERCAILVQFDKAVRPSARISYVPKKTQSSLNSSLMGIRSESPAEVSVPLSATNYNSLQTFDSYRIPELRMETSSTDISPVSILSDGTENSSLMTGSATDDQEFENEITEAPVIEKKYIYSLSSAGNSASRSSTFGIEQRYIYTTNPQTAPPKDKDNLQPPSPEKKPNIISQWNSPPKRPPLPKKNTIVNIKKSPSSNAIIVPSDSTSNGDNEQALSVDEEKEIEVDTDSKTTNPTVSETKSVRISGDNKGPNQSQIIKRKPTSTLSSFRKAASSPRLQNANPKLDNNTNSTRPTNTLSSNVTSTTTPSTNPSSPPTPIPTPTPTPTPTSTNNTTKEQPQSPQPQPQPPTAKPKAAINKSTKLQRSISTPSIPHNPPRTKTIKTRKTIASGEQGNNGPNTGKSSEGSPDKTKGQDEGSPNSTPRQESDAEDKDVDDQKTDGEYAQVYPHVPNDVIEQLVSQLGDKPDLCCAALGEVERALAAAPNLAGSRASARKTSQVAHAPLMLPPRTTDIPATPMMNEGSRLERALMEAQKASLAGRSQFFETTAKVATFLKRKAENKTERKPSQATLRGKNADHMTREEAVLHGRQVLAQRVSGLEIKEHQMGDDGNCLFRAFSHQLYGDQSRHINLRHVAVHQLGMQRHLYNMYFDSKTEYDNYLVRMRQSGEWGDEICIKALCDCMNVMVYVVLSTPDNWYLRYTPSRCKDEREFGTLRKVFLSYLSPIHYNSLTYIDDHMIELSPEETNLLPELRSFSKPVEA